MPTSDFNLPSGRRESDEISTKPRRVTEENAADARKRLKELSLKKSREKLSLLEKGKDNLIAHANARKEELINLAAIEYDLDKEAIEKKYKKKIEEIKRVESPVVKDLESAIQNFDSELKEKKAPEELIREMDSLLDRLDSTLHFTDEEKSRIRDAFSLKKDALIDEQAKAVELNEKRKLIERVLNTLDKLGKVKALEQEMNAELQKLEEKFSSAEKEAEEEYQRILGRVSHVAQSISAEKKRALSVLRSIDSFGLESLELMLNKEDPVQEAEYFTDKDREFQLNVIKTVLFSGAIIAVLGISLHKHRTPDVQHQLAFAELKTNEVPMMFKVDYREFMLSRPQISRTASVQANEVRVQENTKKPSPKVQPKKENSLDKDLKTLEKAIGQIEKTVNMITAIDNARNQLNKVPGDGIIILKQSTKSIVKKFLNDLEIGVRNNSLNERQKAASIYMLERMSIILKMKSKDKKVNISCLRKIGEVSASGFSLNSIRKIRKSIDKEISLSLKKARKVKPFRK